jgi:hypothetical protein
MGQEAERTVVLLFGRYPDDHGLRISRVGEARTSISNGSQVSLPPISRSHLTPTLNLILIPNNLVRFPSVVVWDEQGGKGSEIR